jgi:TfoX/Sxy family transcriptional regulator of competence genes
MAERGGNTLMDRVRAAMRQAPSVEERKMFGGVTFMVRDKMCVSVGKGKIMCRVDPAIHDELLKRKGTRTVVMKGREYRGYIYVTVDALKGKGELDYWVGQALAFNEQAKASIRKGKAS